jgi:hypothetical protein
MFSRQTALYRQLHTAVEPGRASGVGQATAAMIG